MAAPWWWPLNKTAWCASFWDVGQAETLLRGRLSEGLDASGDLAAGQQKKARSPSSPLPSLLLSMGAAHYREEAGPPERGGDQKQQLAVRREGRLLSHRGNLVCAVEAETLWAVRVLRAAVEPNRCLEGAQGGPSVSGALEWVPGGTNMDLLWAWLRALQRNDTPCCPALLVDPRMAEKAAVRNTAPGRLVGAMNVGHSFKIPWPWDPARPGEPQQPGGADEALGLDRYIKARAACCRAHCVLPDGRRQPLRERDAAARGRWYFQRRGRIIMPEAGPLEQPMKMRYCKSGLNCHAGIVETEWMPDEAKDIFGSPVSHGKNLIARDDSGGSLAALFRELDAPFVGAASGSIEQFVLTMEDDCCGSHPDGFVPFWAREVREALIGLQTMTLVAGGQHSIAECLIVAQDMGYFMQVPDVEAGYADAVAGFEQHLSGLGVSPGGGVGPLEQLLDTWDRFCSSSSPAA